MDIKDLANQTDSGGPQTKPHTTVTVRSVSVCIRYRKLAAAQAPNVRIVPFYSRRVHVCAVLIKQRLSMVVKQPPLETISLGKTVTKYGM